MKICLINNLYKPYNRGGAERILELQLEGLVKAGHEVFIITTKPWLGKKPEPLESQKIYRLRSCFYNLGKIPKIFRFFWHLTDIFSFVNYSQIKSILEKERPDIVITHNLKGIGYLTPLVIKNKRIKHIHILHDIQLIHPSGLMIFGQEKEINSLFSKIYAGVCRTLFGSPAIAISPSTWLMEAHQQRKFFSRAKKTILPNPIALAEIYPEKNKSEKKDFIFLYVGQIEDHKGIIFLIEAWKNFAKNYALARLVVAGGGSKLERAKKLASSEAIEFLGPQNKASIKNLMKTSDCLIVPSLCYENSPTVIYEAAEQSLPVIASRLGGAEELVHNLGGVLFNPADKSDLLLKMNWAVSNQQSLEVIGNESRQKIEEFSLDKYIKKLSSFLR